MKNNNSKQGILSAIGIGIKDIKIEQIDYLMLLLGILSFILELLPTCRVSVRAMHKVGQLARLTDYWMLAEALLFIVFMLCTLKLLKDSIPSILRPIVVILNAIYNIIVLLIKFYSTVLNMNKIMKLDLTIFGILFIVIQVIEIAFMILVFTGFAEFSQNISTIKLTKKAVMNSISTGAKDAASGINDMLNYGKQCSSRHKQTTFSNETEAKDTTDTVQNNSNNDFTDDFIQ